MTARSVSSVRRGLTSAIRLLVPFTRAVARYHEEGTEFEPTEKPRDDLNVDAVFARFKTIGGKKQGDEE